jgi:hypothetical protein
MKYTPVCSNMYAERNDDETKNTNTTENKE